MRILPGEETTLETNEGDVDKTTLESSEQDCTALVLSVVCSVGLIEKCQDDSSIETLVYFLTDWSQVVSACDLLIQSKSWNWAEVLPTRGEYCTYMVSETSEDEGAQKDGFF